MSRCIPTGAATITLGVDTHKDTHVGVALDGLGRLQGTLSVAANQAGYRKLLEWASGFGHLEHAGVEGTGSFGAGLARFLKAQEIKVFEVIRPNRGDQYRSGKSDPIDAEAAARAVLAGTATGEPKDADGEVEMICILRTTRRCAVKARAGAANQLQTLLVTAPEGLKRDLCGLSTARLVEKASRLRPGANPSRTWRRPPSSSRCVRWRVATSSSQRRSPNSTSNLTGWSPRPRRSWSPWRALAPTRLPPC